MALPSTRIEYRIRLSHVDRGVELEEGLLVMLHPSETMEHLTLRVLAWCLLHEERIAMGPGLSEPGAPDLETRDLTGRLLTWVECGSADADKVRRVVQQNSGATVHAVFDDARRRRELVEGMAEWKRADEVQLYTLDGTFVRALAAGEGRRRRWAVTIVGDHLYVDADGESLDAPLERGRQ